MKTQISRNAYKADKRYSGVYQQQGRMLTDADWNNLVDFFKGYVAEALTDVVGNGSPRNGALRIDENDRSIVPGDLYIDGLRAELFREGQARIPVNDQPDLPLAPDLPANGTACILYADVWERPLTSLEDPDLRDPGLNGADTTTRTQTMLQVKVCPEDMAPESEIPRKGDAALTLTLQANPESGDPCDPCAGQVDAGGGRIGNYLFRVEVHAVTRTEDGDLSGLTIKWSSENGAEQYTVQQEAQMPPGFVVGQRYVYEFFDLTSEKHIGVHVNPDFTPVSTVLKTAYEIPDGASDPKDFVRRWDGWCELAFDGADWSLTAGWDRGVDLSTQVEDTNHGYVSLDPGLRINLEALQLELDLDQRTFVTGDYWLAPVREAVHIPGSRVLDPSPPEGIAHHYLRLARVAADGSVQRYDDDADRRRHNFPPLTDLDAHDVAYAAACNQGLFQNFSGTVKEALDKICAIQAGDVSFSKPCDTSIYQGQSVDTVADALKLLCNVQAGQIAYSPRADCSYLGQLGVDTVQEALDALCLRPSGGGCKVTVGAGGQFETLDEAIRKLLSRNIFDICICLLPGKHLFGGNFENQFERFSLSIAGCGEGATVVLEKPLRFAGLNALTLKDFDLEALNENLPLSVEDCAAVDISNLHHAGLAQPRPLMRFSGGQHIRLEENILEAYGTIGLEHPQKVFDFDPALVKLFSLAQRDAFLARVPAKADEWAHLHQNERLKVARNILQRLEELKKPPANIRFVFDEEFSYRLLADALQGPAVDADTLADSLREVRDQAHHAAAGTAVVFMDAGASLSLEDNTVFGGVAFYGQPGQANLTSGELEELAAMFKPPAELKFLDTGATLQAWDNRFSRLQVGEQMIKTLQELIRDTEKALPVQGVYRTAQFESTIIAGARNQLLFADLTLTAADFQTLAEPEIGWTVAATAIFTGNRVRRARTSDTGGNTNSIGGGRMHIAAGDLGTAANLPNRSW